MARRSFYSRPRPTKGCSANITTAAVATFFSIESWTISTLLNSGSLVYLTWELIRIIPNAAYIQKLNKSQKVVKEGPVKMVDQFQLDNSFF
jgi:hypothetical protein